jgi:hypothetical protein
MLAANGEHLDFPMRRIDSPFGGSGGRRPIFCLSRLSSSSACLLCLRIFFCSFLVNMRPRSSCFLSIGAGMGIGCWIRCVMSESSEVVTHSTALSMSS